MCLGHDDGQGRESAIEKANVSAECNFSKIKVAEA